jgi:hypothetical protein
MTSSPRKFSVTHVNLDTRFFSIHRDLITILNKGDRPTLKRLRHNVPNNKTVGATRKPAISDEGYIRTQASTH